ncbi:hypothetical protein FUAX_16900 [Fulvitalea axinellae]|uniref:Thioredoxin domain-containing protein n=2 Tax=Fulvitalea axinellae TaxID=1182444 RepID=A0AAU9CMM0_9BACT|nr:hypothetical protein FUAX_16900 [Fulvitalea axinellae]
MRTFFFLLLMTFSLFAEAQPNERKGYDIRLKVEGLQADEVYIGYHYASKSYILDTAKVGDLNIARFKSDTTVLQPGVYFFHHKAPDLYLEFVVGDEGREFSFSTKNEDLLGSLKVEGSVENQLFKEYQGFIVEKNAEKKVLEEGLADVKEDKAASETLQGELSKLNDEVSEYQRNLLEKHPKAIVSELVRLVLPVEFPDDIKKADEIKRFRYYKKHYFDNLDLSSPSFLRNPMGMKKVESYLKKYTYQHPDSIYASAERILALSRASQANYRHFLFWALNDFLRSNIMGAESGFVKLADKHLLVDTPSWASEATVKKVRERAEDLRPNLIGAVAPELHLLDSTLNTPVFLEQIPQDYVVLYFYDPDCGHCKKESPKLLKAYNNGLKDLGVEVMAVTVVTDMKKWKNYIDELGMNWVNAADPYVQSNFRKHYDLKTTPIIYILDRDRKIIARKIGAEHVKGFIEHKIKEEKTNQ